MKQYVPLIFDIIMSIFDIEPQFNIGRISAVKYDIYIFHNAKWSGRGRPPLDVNL